MDVLPHINSLRRWVEAEEFAGWDPYDALNSATVRFLTFGTKQGRMAWTQLFRRSPVNLRPLLGVPRRLNAKGLGLFLEAYSKLYEQGARSKEQGGVSDTSEKAESGNLRPEMGRAEMGGQKAEDGGRRTEDGGQEAWKEGQSQELKLGKRKAEIANQTSESRKQKAEMERRGDKDLRFIIADIVGKLEELRGPGASGAAWGYPFDWQSRAAFVPAGTPTIVNTAFIGHALLDCHERTGVGGALEIALAIPPFLLKDLHRSAESGPFCFSYTPLDRNFVHNANMLGASLLLRLGRQAGNSEWLDAARRSMSHSIERQRPGGSWPYAETDFQGWIDSFHTGFNLEALRWFVRLDDAPAAWREVYRKGVEYYATRFFLEDGTPKYYHDRVYPIDIHAPAEAVYFFSGEGPAYRELTDKVLGWMLKSLWDERGGYFYFRKSRYLTNKIPYMRWSQAWGMRALAEYHVQRSN